MPNANSNEEAAIRLNNEINKVLSENPHADAGEIVREAAGLTVGHAGSVPFAAPAPGAAVPSAGKSVEMPALTVQAILDRMDTIQKEKSYLNDAMEALAAMPQSSPGDIAGQGKAEALGKAVAAREETNRKMLSLLEKMYDDLRPVRPSYSSNDLAKDKFRIMTDLISESNITEDAMAELLSRLVELSFNVQ